MSNSMVKNRYLDNLVDKPFQNIFFPMNTVLSMTLLPHFKFRDGFITPNNCSQKLRTFLFGIGLIVVHYFRFKASIEPKKNETFSCIIISVYYDWIYYSFTLICLVTCSVINTEYYVNLVLNLQKAFRNFNSIDKTVKNLVLWNWVSMIVVPTYFLASFLAINNYSFAEVLNFLPVMCFDVIVVYTSRVMRLIENELKIWLDEMQCCNGRVNPTIVDLERNENVNELKMFQTYRYILNAYDLFKKVCKVPILFELTEIIAHVLIYLQVNIDIKTERPEESLGTFLLNYRKMIIIFWVLKNCILLLIICDSCENFYSHVTKAEQICNEALMDQVTDEFRQLCKNVRRYNRARFSRWRVCGATVDARLPVELVQIVTAHIVVILQFNFL